MYLCSISAQGQIPLSFSPLLSGFPTEWRQGTNSPSVPITSRTFFPARVMISIFITTYAESVISIPFLEIGEPSGPIQKGITYIVRPCIHPVYKPVIVAFNSFGSIQWFVGPASSSFLEEMKVRDSTRATSEGSERNRTLLGFFLSEIASPQSIISF